MGLLDTPMNYDVTGLYVPRSVRSRADAHLKRHVLFQENGVAWPPGMWNDGVGDAYSDAEIMFGSRPTIRLQTQGQTNGSATNPGRTANTSGVVYKRRIQDGFSGIFAIDLWFRLTSTNNNGVANPLFSVSIYNRTGTDTDGTQLGLARPVVVQPERQQQEHRREHSRRHGHRRRQRRCPADRPHGRLHAGRPPTSRTAPARTTTTRQPSSGRLDRAGGWHYAYLAVDLKNKKYVECQVDSNPIVDLSTYNLDQTTSAGAAMMHFSTEYSATTSTDRFMNIANVTGYGA
jgi:hypothetical protein